MSRNGEDGARRDPAGEPAPARAGGGERSTPDYPREEYGPKLSVVIPALNEEEHVGDLLSDLAAQSRRAEEVTVVDAGSEDGTAAVAGRFPFARLLRGERPVARGRNLGGRRSSGDLILFLDADVRLPRRFLEGLSAEVARRKLDVACPKYVPYRSTAAIERVHGFYNALFKTFEGTLPSGAGHCIAVRREAFLGSGGFDPGLKFDDIEFVRRTARGRRFGIVEQEILVSDRRYRRHGILWTSLQHLLMAPMFAAGKFSWANRMDYEFGEHASPGSGKKDRTARG